MPALELDTGLHVAGTVRSAGIPVRLDNARLLVARIRRPDGSEFIRRAARGDQGRAPGSWSLALEPHDVRQAGTYGVQIVVTWADERHQTFPAYPTPVDIGLRQGIVADPLRITGVRALPGPTASGTRAADPVLDPPDPQHRGVPTAGAATPKNDSHITYQVAGRRSADGWELDVAGIGVTHVTDLDQAAQEVRNYLEAELNIDSSGATVTITLADAN
jgi:hypothetical protein